MSQTGHQNLGQDLSAHQGSKCFRVALRLDAVNQSHFGTTTPVNAWPLTHRSVWYTGAVTFVDLFISKSRCCRRDDPRECQGRVTEGQLLFTSCDMAHVPLSQESEKSSQHCWQFSSRSVKYCTVKTIRMSLDKAHIPKIMCFPVSLRRTRTDTYIQTPWTEEIRGPDGWNLALFTLGQICRGDHPR